MRRHCKLAKHTWPGVSTSSQLSSHSKRTLIYLLASPECNQRVIKIEHTYAEPRHKDYIFPLLRRPAWPLAYWSAKMKWKRHESRSLSHCRTRTQALNNSASMRRLAHVLGVLTAARRIISKNLGNAEYIRRSVTKGLAYWTIGLNNSARRRLLLG